MRYALAVKTNRAVRWVLRIRGIVAVAALIALGTFQVGAASRWFRNLGPATRQTAEAGQAYSTDAGAAVMWASM
jgi:hypothetical protein